MTELTLPKASVGRRVAASGLETFLLLLCMVGLSAIGPLTVFLSEIFCVLLAILWGVKDLGGGAYSLSKVLTRTRVVDKITGEMPSPDRLILRNSYYLVLCLCSAIPFVEWATLSIVAIVMMVDLLVMISSPDNRRIGDFIAGTQVVPIDR